MIEETTAFWNKVGLANRPTFYCKVYRWGYRTGDVFIGEPYQQSLATAMGTQAPAPLDNQGTNSTPTLRAYDDGSTPLNKRMWCLIDQTGTAVKKGPPPDNYALRSGYPYPTAQERAYDYSWPVDFDKSEDLDYLGKQLDGEPFVVFGNDSPPTLEGEIDKSGKFIFKPEFEFLGVTSNGLTTFRRPKEKIGYLNEHGQIAIEPQYDSADTFYEGLAAVGKNHKFGFIDTTGTVVIPLKFDSVRRFSEGLAPARIGPKFGYIDKTGKFVIEPQFGRARHFVNGLAYVQIDGRRAYIDHSGKPIGGCFYERLKRFSCDRAVFMRDGKYGYLDRSGNEVIPAQYTDADDFRDGVAKVREGSATKAIDASGKAVVVPPSHSDFWDGPITENLIRTQVDVKHGYKYGFKNQANEIVIKPDFDNVGVFRDGLCPAEVNGKWGVIDTKGNFLIQPKFDETSGQFKEHRLAVRIGAKWGIVNASGKMIVEPKYDAIPAFENGMAIVQSGIKYGYVSASGTEVIPPQFDAAHNFGPTGRARIEMRQKPLEPMNFLEPAEPAKFEKRQSPIEPMLDLP